VWTAQTADQLVPQCCLYTASVQPIHTDVQYALLTRAGRQDGPCIGGWFLTCIHAVRFDDLFEQLVHIGLKCHCPCVFVMVVSSIYRAHIFRQILIKIDQCRDNGLWLWATERHTIVLWVVSLCNSQLTGKVQSSGLAYFLKPLVYHIARIFVRDEVWSLFGVEAWNIFFSKLCILYQGGNQLTEVHLEKGH